MQACHAGFHPRHRLHVNYAEVLRREASSNTSNSSFLSLSRAPAERATAEGTSAPLLSQAVGPSPTRPAHKDASRLGAHSRQHPPTISRSTHRNTFTRGIRDCRGEEIAENPHHNLSPRVGPEEGCVFIRPGNNGPVMGSFSVPGLEYRSPAGDGNTGSRLCRGFPPPLSLSHPP